jgi:excisionase family DNA binding protein
MKVLETTGNALLDLSEVAHRLGVSRKTARRLIWSENLPAARIGHKRGQLRVDERDLEQWVRSRRIQGDPE